MTSRLITSLPTAIYVSIVGIELVNRVMMVISYCVVSCTNRHSKEDNRLFFVIPKVITHQGLDAKQLSERRRTAWLAKINRKDWVPGSGSRVCSDHFVSSKPADLFNQTNPDWVPTLKLGYSSIEPDGSRHERLEERRKRFRDVDTAHTLLELNQGKRPCKTNTSSTISGVACQTDDMPDHEREIKKLRIQVEQLTKGNQALRSEVACLKPSGTCLITPDALQASPQLLKFYTGNYARVDSLYGTLQSHRVRHF